MPTLTPAEIAQLQAERAKQVNFRDSFDAAVPAKTARAVELSVADGAFKKFFDYYNDGIIAKYDAERKALDGYYIAAPITEADILGPATLDGSVRTTPASAATTDITRVAQFDGGPLVTTALNETQAILDQLVPQTILVSGYGGSGFNTLTAVTDSALTPSSTSLIVKDPTNALALAVNDVFVLVNGSDLAVVKVTAITVAPGGTAPYSATYAVSLIVAPAGTIPTATSLKYFTGFTNSERTTKTPVDAAYQPLMNYLVLQLQNAINARKARLAEQITALSGNLDPDATSEIAGWITALNTNITNLNTYLATTDISNGGINGLQISRVNRLVAIGARLAQIATGYTGRTLNYYNERYNFANNRGNTARGTLRLQKATEQAVTQLGSYAAGAQASITAIDSLLP
jgi:hypothetical protein